MSPREVVKKVLSVSDNRGLKRLAKWSGKMLFDGKMMSDDLTIG